MKLFSLTLALVLSVGLVACKSKEADQNKNEVQKTSIDSNSTSQSAEKRVEDPAAKPVDTKLPSSAPGASIPTVNQNAALTKAAKELKDLVIALIPKARALGLDADYVNELEADTGMLEAYVQNFISTPSKNTQTDAYLNAGFIGVDLNNVGLGAGAANLKAELNAASAKAEQVKLLIGEPN